MLIPSPRPIHACTQAIRKAVIDIASRGSVFGVVRKQRKAAEANARYGADYHLSFESARALFSELTPARIDLLEALRQCGPCSVYALAKQVERNYSNVHTDIGQPEEHGLVKRTTQDGGVVAFESVEVRRARVE